MSASQHAQYCVPRESSLKWNGAIVCVVCAPPLMTWKNAVRKVYYHFHFFCSDLITEFISFTDQI